EPDVRPHRGHPRPRLPRVRRAARVHRRARATPLPHRPAPRLRPGPVRPLQGAAVPAPGVQRAAGRDRGGRRDVHRRRQPPPLVRRLHLPAADADQPVRGGAGSGPVLPRPAAPLDRALPRPPAVGGAVRPHPVGVARGRDPRLRAAADPRALRRGAAGGTGRERADPRLPQGRRPPGAAGLPARDHHRRAGLGRAAAGVRRRRLDRRADRRGGGRADRAGRRRLRGHRARRGGRGPVLAVDHPQRAGRVLGCGQCDRRPRRRVAGRLRRHRARPGRRRSRPARRPVHEGGCPM
ncbi:MAG: Integral membrane protein, partial [uncultured Nocardioides sp.]